MIEIDKDIFKAPLDEVLYDVQHVGKFKTVLNLETHTKELIFGDGNDLFRGCYYNSVRLFDMAWSGVFPPKKKDVTAAMDVLKTEPKPIVFGCRHARERAGFLLAVYRMQVQGFSFSHAYARWKQEGCRWPIYILWKSELRKREK